MEVRDGFAGVRAVVHHEAEAFGEVEFFCDDACDKEKVPEGGLVGGGGFGDARDQPFRDDEEMDGRLRINVVEHDAVLVLVFDLRGDFAVDDALKDGLGHLRKMNHRGTEVTEESDSYLRVLGASVVQFTKTVAAGSRCGWCGRR